MGIIFFLTSDRTYDKILAKEEVAMPTCNHIKSAWITMGEKVIEFEQKFATFLNSKSKCVAMTNGTAALHMSLLAIGIDYGDEVIIPAVTFVADINVVKKEHYYAILRCENRFCF